MAVAKRVFFVFMVLMVLTSVYSITRGNTQQALAATPATLNFQARLMTSSGNLVPDGNYNIEFKLYNTATSTGSSQGACTGDVNCLWTETRTGGSQVQVKNGYLSAYLGDVTALPSNIWDQQLWLTMNIGGTGLAVWDGEMTPRIRMTSVPYAFQAKSAETLNKTVGSYTGTVDFSNLTDDRRFLFPDTSLATTASPGTICVYNGAASNCPAASGSAYYIQNDVVLQPQTNFHIQARDSGVTGTIGGILRGAANGQTVDLLQFQASNGGVLAAITATGNMEVASSLDTRTATTLSVGTANAAAISIGSTGMTATVNGALAVTEAFSANGGATIVGTTDVNTTGTSVTTIGNVAAGIVLNGVVTANEEATFNDTVTIAAEKTIRFVGGATAQRPISPDEGMMYFDTTTKQLLIYANGKWQADRSTATKIVAASNSQNKESADFVADGSDDEVTIQQAISALPAGGGLVYLLDGEFSLGAAIVPQTNVTITGQGRATILKTKNSADINAFQNAGLVYNFALTDMVIDGNKSTNPGSVGGNGFYAWLSDSRIERVEFRNIKKTALRLCPVAISSTLCFQNRIYDNQISDADQYGIWWDYPFTDSTIEGNNIGAAVADLRGEGNTGRIINNHLNGAPTNNIIFPAGAGSYTITGNIIEHASQDAIVFQVPSFESSTEYHKMLISNNDFRGCSVDYDATYSCIKINGYDGSKLARGFTITGNNFESKDANDPLHFISLTNVDQVTISGNDFSAASLPGDPVATAGVANNVTIIGNTTQTTNVIQGSLGIGVSPTTKLQVGEYTDLGPSLSFGTDSNANLYGMSAYGGYLNMFTDNGFKFFEDVAGTKTERLRIEAGGAVAITGVLDTLSAGALQIGTTTANAISIGKTGVLTTNNGALTVSEAFTASSTAQFNGAVTVAADLTVTNAGNVAFQRSAADYAATGVQDNVSFGTGALFRIASLAPVTINGISGGADGRLITLVNASANAVTLGNSASGTAANHIVTGTGGALTIPAGSSVQLAYDSSSNVWRVIGGTATQGGAANQQLSNLSGTVAINLGLVAAAGSDNALDLGSATTGWRSLYADTSVLTPLVGRATAGTLEIGTDTNSTAVTISRTSVLTTVAGSLQVNQGTELRGGLTVTNGGNVAIQRNGTNYTATGTQDNVNFGTGALFRIASASAVTINGIAGGADGRLITLMNASANAVTLGNSASGTAANHIVTGTGGALTIPAGSSVQLAYDSSSNVWRVIGGTATQGGAANQQLSNLSGTVAINLGLVPAAAQDNALDLGSASYGWRTVYADTSVLTALIDTQSATALNIGTTNATQINLNKNTQVTGNITLAQGANRELRVEARSTAGAGYNLTVAAGAANGAGNAGGALLLQGGAAVAGNANGGAVTIAGGAGSGTGTQGLVNLSTTAFTSSGVQTYNTIGVNNITAGLVDQYSTIPVLATTTTGIIVSVPDPAQNTVIGRVLYIAARDTSLDFTLRLNASGTPIDIAMKKNSTATLIWNGDEWTAAGASSSTDLQSAYNNTLTSAGGAEIILNPTGGAADGFTIRNNGTTPIVGGLLEVQSSIGTNLFSVNSAATEWAANGGAETASAFGTDWTAVGSAGAPVRTTTAGQYVTGQAGVSSAFGTAAGNGVRNNLATNPTPGNTLQISFTAKLGPGSPISDLRVDYTPTGASTGTLCTSGQSLSTTEWTKITCEVVTPGTSVTNPDILIYQVGAAGVARTIYIDNLSVTRANATDVPSNVQIGGGINGGQVTLFTLDRSSSPPVEDGNTTYYGSMYYDTTTGRIQCYEADGWGACGSPPDNIITLTPEYTGAVLNGNGIGVLTADFCGDGVLNVEAVFCGTGEARNYYRWTSPQATDQTYSIYVNYKLPSTFKEFASANTMKITTRTDDLSLARADIEVFRKAASGGITSCGSHTTLNNALNQWQQKDYSGNEMSCGFQGSDYIIFKVTVHSSQSKNVYIENIDFTYLND